MQGLLGRMLAGCVGGKSWLASGQRRDQQEPRRPGTSDGPPGEVACRLGIDRHEPLARSGRDGAGQVDDDIRTIDEPGQGEVVVSAPGTISAA